MWSQRPQEVKEREVIQCQRQALFKYYLLSVLENFLHSHLDEVRNKIIIYNTVYPREMLLSSK